MRRCFCLTFCLTLVLSGCRAQYVLENPDQQLYLQTNLRANAHGHITSVLSWRGTEVVAICIPVKVDLVRKREIRFHDDSGKQYRYILHRSTRLSVEDHLERYFAASCPVDVMEPADAQGIHQGTARGGMSRTGVLYALGYPPEHRTPSLSDDEWVYWGTKGHVTVHFMNDRVVTVEDPAHPASAQGQVAVSSPAVTANAAAPQDTVVVVAPAPSAPALQRSPARETRRARRRRRLRMAGRVAGVAAAHAPRAQVSVRHSTTRTSSSSSGAGTSHPPGSSNPPAPTVTRRAPDYGALHDRCGSDRGCGQGLACDISGSRQCRLLPGTFGEALRCTSSDQCAQGSVCGVSRLTPERGRHCWSEPSLVQ